MMLQSILTHNHGGILARHLRAFASKRTTLEQAQVEIMKKKTPRGKLDNKAPEKEGEEEEKPYEPYSDPALPRHPGGVNPITGEIGGPAGLEPTRYGDWERKGHCVDF